MGFQSLQGTIPTQERYAEYATVLRVSIPSRYDPNPLVRSPNPTATNRVSIPSRYDPNRLSRTILHRLTLVSIPSRYDPNAEVEGIEIVGIRSFNPFKVRSQLESAMNLPELKGCFNPFKVRSQHRNSRAENPSDRSFNPFKVRSQPRRVFSRDFFDVQVSIPSRYDPNETGIFD